MINKQMTAMNMMNKSMQGMYESKGSNEQQNAANVK